MYVLIEISTLFNTKTLKRQYIINLNNKKLVIPFTYFFFLNILISIIKHSKICLLNMQSKKNQVLILVLVTKSNIFASFQSIPYYLKVTVSSVYNILFLLVRGLSASVSLSVQVLENCNRKYG